MNSMPSLPNAQITKYIRKRNDATKEIFKNRIHPNFLIKIRDEVLSSFGDNLFNFYTPYINLNHIISGDYDSSDYDICRIIIGIHRHYSIFLTEQEIRSNEKNRDYQKKLINEVIEKIRIRRFSSYYFRKFQFQYGDELMFFPVPYELFALCMRSKILISGNINHVFKDFHKVINAALSSLTLMENNFLSNAYPLCRGMIEQYLKILILNKHPENRIDYDCFCSYEIEQSCCSQKYPEKFIEEYNNRILLSSKSKVDYLHYGWLDKIANYNTDASNRYSIYGILNYLKVSATNDQYDELNHIETLYKTCHAYTHGSAYCVKYPLLQYFEISTMLYYVLTGLFEYIHNELNKDFLQEDEVLINMLKRDFATLRDQNRNQSTENFDLYYRIHQPEFNADTR